MPSQGSDERLAHWLHVHDVISKRADLDNNGRVDVRDVEVFEKRFNLSGSFA